MEYDLYTSDDRCYARVVQPDVGESSSSSSYAGSDASNALGRSPPVVATVGKILPSNRLSVDAETTMTGDGESRIHETEYVTGTDTTPRGLPDPLMPPHHGWTRPSSGSGQEPGEGQEELGDATNEASGPSEHDLGAGTPSQDDDAHSTQENDNNLSSEMDLQGNDSDASGRAVPDRDAGRGSRLGSSRRTIVSAESDTSGRRSPPLERIRGNSVNSNRNIREIILPRWQPDAEVTYCPICRTQFSFFVRKHHCRRCGRVVCNACSPHRITIPYQFIVQPPPAVAAPSISSISQLGSNTSTHVIGATSDFADRNGGMKVRLCNPCVPDPNPLPPQPQYSDMNGEVPTLYVNSGSRPYSFTEESTTTSSSGRVRGLSAASGIRPSDQRPQQRSTSPYNRHTGTNIPNNGPNSPYPNLQTGRYPGHMPRGDPLRVPGSSASSTDRSSQSPSRAQSSQNRGHASRHQSLSFIPGGSIPNPQPHYRSLLDTGSDQYVRTSLSSNRPLPPVPHSEEDECPVCHRVLFSRTLPDFENRRAAHIMQCIDEQIAFHSGNSSRPGAYTSQSQPPPTTNPDDVLPPHPEPQTAEPSIPNTPEARAAARERAHAAVVLGTTSSGSSTPPARRTGMFIYRASEKDCVDDAECTICLEEFEVGTSMARLECFCRFHKKCIQDWFVDHPGRCPVHQHDGYGF